MDKKDLGNEGCFIFGNIVRRYVYTVVGIRSKRGWWRGGGENGNTTVKGEKRPLLSTSSPTKVPMLACQADIKKSLFLSLFRWQPRRRRWPGRWNKSRGKSGATLLATRSKVTGGVGRSVFPPFLSFFAQDLFFLFFVLSLPFYFICEGQNSKVGEGEKKEGWLISCPSEEEDQKCRFHQFLLSRKTAKTF